MPSAATGGPAASGHVAVAGLIASADQQHHVGALTAVRGIAAWWVVCYHFREFAPSGLPGPVEILLGNGHHAVDLFFILSGYVIGLNYLRRMVSLNIASIVQFYLLRLARVYPLHLFMLIIFLANPIVITYFSAAGVPGARYEWGYFVLSILLIQNWGFTDALAWNVPAWSISTEFFAYLLFPFLAASIPARQRGVTGSLALIGVCLGAIALIFGLQGKGLGEDIARLGLVRCVIEFAIGMLLCQVVGRLREVSSLGLPCALAAMALYASCLFGLPDYGVVPLAWTLLVFALAQPRAIPSRVLNLRWLIAVGTVSYSTYMVHYFVRDWVKFTMVTENGPDVVACAAYLGATALASIILYRMVEVPGRQRGSAFARRIGDALAARMSGRTDLDRLGGSRPAARPRSRRSDTDG